MRYLTMATAAAAVPALILGTSGIAAADNVQNDVVVGGSDTITAGGSTTVNYRISQTSNDGQQGCNASDGTPAKVNLSVPAGVTASATQLTFSACNSYQGVTFSAADAGTYNVTVSSVQDAGAGTYTVNQATWSLKVNAPANTKPSVAVTDVTDGSSYEIGNVKAARCQVTDAEDGNSSHDAVITGSLSHGIGNQTATCDYTDAGGLKADTKTATYTIVDTGAPAINHSITGSKNTNGWYNKDVTVEFTCEDEGGSGIETCTGDTTLGEGANQSVTGTATDYAGNTATDTVSGINIDKTAPSVALVGGPGGSYYFGNDPAAPTCDASDGLSGLDGSCAVTGGGSSVGEHSYTATATDKAGNSASDALSYSVLGWSLKGFTSPVDMGGVLNTVKGGSTVPMKFRVFAGSDELTSTSAISSFKTQKVSCASGSGTEDAIEVVSTGGTSLRYDTTGGQFIQNWKTPTGAGTCYSATVTTQDGSSISALFKTK